MDKKKEEISLHTKEVEQIIEKYLPKEEGFQKKVIEAMNYSFLAGGKRLRPMLMLETYRLFGGKGKVIEPFMAAILIPWCTMICRQWITMRCGVESQPHTRRSERRWRSSPVTDF